MFGVETISGCHLDDNNNLVFLGLGDSMPVIMELNTIDGLAPRLETLKKHAVETNKVLAKKSDSYFDLLSENLEIFTTRPDTIFGATFIAISPQHELAKKIAKKHDLKIVLAKAAINTDLFPMIPLIKYLVPFLLK